MALSAAPAYDHIHAATDFAAMSSGVQVSTQPLKSFESKTPAQIKRLEFQVVGAQSQIDRAVAQVFDSHKKATRSLGLAGVERGKAANVINPPKDIMLGLTAMAVPAFAPVASALAIASVINYMNADRKGHGKNRNLQALFEDQLRSAHSPRGLFDVPWQKTGYHAVKSANDSELSLEEFELLARPPEQNYNMQILLGQRAQVENIEASNENRALKGVPVSEESVEMAIDMDSKRLHDSNRAALNLPGHSL